MFGKPAQQHQLSATQTFSDIITLFKDPINISKVRQDLFYKDYSVSEFRGKIVKVGHC